MKENSDYKEIIKKLEKKFGLKVCNSAISIYNYVDKKWDKIIKEVQVGMRDYYPKADNILKYSYSIWDTFIWWYFTIDEVIDDRSYKSIWIIDKDFKLIN